MNPKNAEIVASFTTILALAAAILWPFSHEKTSRRRNAPPAAPIVTLTALAATGTWTEEQVNGGNYWNRAFPPARPVLQVGKSTLLRLKSADVNHTFYCPGLGVGPVEVHPGLVAETLVTPAKEGVFGYYCTTFCGDAHFAMLRGAFVVQADAGSIQVPSSPSFEKFWLKPPPGPGSSRVERGKWLFTQKGCFTCHGAEGRGGVSNWNYVTGSIPALNTLAEKMMLVEREDASTIVQFLERGVALESLADAPPVPRFKAVLAQYQAIGGVIRNGSIPGKKDPQGPTPPLEMPAWGQRLAAGDIDALIAYLLTLQHWEEEGKE